MIQFGLAKACCILVTSDEHLFGSSENSIHHTDLRFLLGLVQLINTYSIDPDFAIASYGSKAAQLCVQISPNVEHQSVDYYWELGCIIAAGIGQSNISTRSTVEFLGGHQQYWTIVVRDLHDLT
jgi:hypothetical protein